MCCCQSLQEGEGEWGENKEMYVRYAVEQKAPFIWRSSLQGCVPADSRSSSFTRGASM